MSQATLAQENWTGNQQVSLLDLLDRLLEKGVVVDGEILLTVADIDLVYLGLKCVLSSVETLEKNSRESAQGGRRNLTAGYPEPFVRHSDPERSEGEESGGLEGKLREGSRPPKGAAGPPLAEDPSPLSLAPPVPRTQDDAGREIASPPKSVADRNDDPVASPTHKDSTKYHCEDETSFFKNAEAKGTHPNPEPRNKINVDAEKVEKGLVKLVLTVVELLRKLMERQAIRRMEGGSLRPKKMEELGLAFLRLDEKMEELKKFFGLKDEDLNLSLGPLGNLI